VANQTSGGIVSRRADGCVSPPFFGGLTVRDTIAGGRSAIGLTNSGLWIDSVYDAGSCGE